MSIDLVEIHTFACQLAIEAGSYLRDQALARASRARGAAAYDLELTIKENAAVSPSLNALAAFLTRAGAAGPGHESRPARRGAHHERYHGEVPCAQVRFKYALGWGTGAHVATCRIIGEESYSAGQEKRFLLDDVSRPLALRDRRASRKADRA